MWRLVYEDDGTLVGGIGGGTSFLVFWGEEKTEIHKLGMPNTAHDMDRHPRDISLATAHHDGHIRITRMEQKDV